jgi:hypothetical protein
MYGGQRQMGGSLFFSPGKITAKSKESTGKILKSPPYVMIVPVVISGVLCVEENGYVPKVKVDGQLHVVSGVLESFQKW